ncbi:hypothetical protein, partial [[Ruminococcus] torques]
MQTGMKTEAGTATDRSLFLSKIKIFVKRYNDFALSINYLLSFQWIKDNLTLVLGSVTITTKTASPFRKGRLNKLKSGP